MTVAIDLTEAAAERPRVAGTPGESRIEDGRELGTAETLTNQAHMFGALMAGGIMKISGPLTPELVRRGLDWLQDEHPILRAHIVRKGTRYTAKLPFVSPRLQFETEGTAPIPLLSVVDPDPQAGLLMMQEMLRRPIPHGPLPRIKMGLVRPSEAGGGAELIFAVDHTIADAHSAMVAMAQLMEFFADPDGMRAARGRAQRLAPSLDTALLKKSDNGKPYEPMIRLPAGKYPRGPIGTAAERRYFSVAETEVIKAQLKARKLTLHGLVTAAILKGIEARFRVPEMTVLSSVDLRRNCRPVIGPDVFGCFIDVVRTRHRIDLPLWDVARDVTFGLITTLARDHESASALRPPTWDMIRGELFPLVFNRLRGDGLVITTAGETGLRRDYGQFVLEDMTGLISQEVIGAGFFAMVFEREGVLEVSLCYAPHCNTQEEAAAVADVVAENLRNLPA